jgi:hypothetical protein
MATVVRLQRRGGVVLRPYDVYIGRAMYQGGWRLPASKWANPFRIGPDGTRRDVLEKFERYLRDSPSLLRDLPELEGLRLGCWCVDPADAACPVCRAQRGVCAHYDQMVCHGEVLVKLLAERRRDAAILPPEDDPIWAELLG